MPNRTAAHLVINTLAEIGIKRIYGVVGDSLNGLTDAIRSHPDLEWIGTRHEEVAAFAASGESQVTGELAVCAGSCGPGNMHLINGLYDAHRTRTPVLAIAAHIPSSEIGSGYFQETRPQDLFRECSHYCELVSDVSQLPYVLDNAIRAAIGKRGVAVIVIPGDVALRPVQSTEPTSRASLQIAPPVVVPDEAQIEALLRHLSEASRITIFAGRGCAGAHEQVVALAGKLQSPIVHALGGKEHIEYDNPYDVGMTGLIGFSSGYAAMQSCDLLLMLGTDFPYKQFYPGKAKVIQIDICPENLGRRARLTLGLVGDIRATLETILGRVEQKTDQTFLKAALEHYQKARSGLDKLASHEPSRKLIHPQYLARLLSERAEEDAVFTADVGTCTVWAARYLKMNGKRRLIGSFTHGSMANAMPQALGIKAACPQRQVITFSGDGGLSMLLGDLITLKQHDIPVKVVVFNNSVLGFVALEMKASGFLETGVELKNPDFAAIARATGLHGIKVEDADQLPAAIDEFLAHPGPALLDVATATQELVMPPSIQQAQAKGFSLWGLKAVMSGHSNELIDLAKVNLLQR